MLIHTRRDGQHAVDRATDDITGLEAALPRVIDTSGDRFRIQLQGRSYDSRVDAAGALARWANNSDLKWAPRYTNRDMSCLLVNERFAQIEPRNNERGVLADICSIRSGPSLSLTDLEGER